MRKINVGNDYAFREQLKAEALKEKEQHDNDSTAGTEATGGTEEIEQADTQEPAQEEEQEKKKGKGKKAKD